MKKFFTLCAAMLATAASFAQEETTFSFVHNDQVVTNGGTVNVSTADIENIAGFYFIPEYNSHLYAKNNSNSEATVIATIEEITSDPSGVYVGICAGGTCENLTATKTSASKTATIAAGGLIDLEIEAKGTATTVESEANKFDAEYNSVTRVSLQLQGDPDDITTITLNMGRTATGISYVSSVNKVALHGRTLSYQFANSASRTLCVYNVSGAAVMSQPLSNASGTVSLNNLPTGIYIYKISGAAGLCGKVVIK
jgi:hypothetical protein